MIAGLYTLSTSLIWGVNTLFLLDAGLSIFEVFVANAVFTGSMALFEIPTGVVADTRGRRKSFLLSVGILLLGTLGYVGVASIHGGIGLFCIMSIVLGIGYTFYSGAVEAWLVDALHATDFGGKLDQVFATGSIVTGVAMLVGSILGGILGDVSLSLPFLVRSAFLAAAFGVAWFTMFDHGFAVRGTAKGQLMTEMRRVAGESIQFGWQRPATRMLMLAGAVQGLFIAWGFYAWQPYFLGLLGRDLVWVSGTIAALVALATIGGNGLVKLITRYCGKRTTLLLWAASVQVVAIVGVGLTSSFWVAVSLYLVNMLAMGLWSPVRQAYMHHDIPSEHRASVISFDSLVSSGGSMFGQLGLGHWAQSASIASGYLVGGATQLVVLPLVLMLRRLGEHADVIVGDAGKNGPCAAQGIPAVSSLDASPPVGEPSVSES